MTPDEFRQRFIKSRALNLTRTPVPAPEIPIAPPTPVQTVPIVPTEPPIRTNPDGTIAGNLTSNPTDNPNAWKPAPPVVASPPSAAAVAEPPARVTSAFPTGGTAPVVATKPVIEQAPGGGISLASNPIAHGWAGTVGLPATPEAAQSFMAGQKYNDLMAGLEQMAKGVKNKPEGKSDLNTITPMSVQPNSPNQLSSELMNSILQNRRRKYGISLAG